MIARSTLSRGQWLAAAYGLSMLLATSQAVLADDVANWIETIQAVDGKGDGHQAAVKAVQQLQRENSEALLPILEGLETANPLAANWLRNAFETIAAATVNGDGTLPTVQLLEFLNDTTHRPESRAIVFAWLSREMPEQADAMIPTFLNDPSDELRRKAVGRLIGRAEKLSAEEDAQAAEKKAIYQQALTGASDDDQVKQIVKGLKAFDVEVDLQRHYGLLTEWSIIGPFDNKDEQGFPVVYPPEQQFTETGSINRDAEYEGQLGSVSWKTYSTDDAYGELDLADLVGPYKGAIQYAYTEFESDADQPIEFRLATPNAWKLWVNGELVFAREEYHRGTFFDMYRIPAKFNKGKNKILLKSCQNEQEQSWAQDWTVQFRVCTPFGIALQQAE